MVSLVKRLLSVILSLCLTCSIVPPAFATSSEANEAAQALYELGLFSGTETDPNGNPVFDLDRAPTRNEAVTMLVRLLGKGEEAANGMWSTPFIDVADWAKPYVGYAYTNGLTSGTSATTYGGDHAVTASEYLTFVLRALGYSSATDFQWDRAWELSDRLGITHGQYHADTTNFTRGDVAIISYEALHTALNGTSITLFATLGISDDTTTAPDVQPKQPETQITWYGESEYRVGSDIPAGEYYAVQTASNPGYYCIYPDTSKEDIEQNEIFHNYTFFQVENGQLLEVNRCEITPVSNVQNSIAKQEDGYYIEGSYRVGIDIPAGEYQFVAASTNRPGYYCAYADVTKEDIVHNDNFDGNAYYKVENGQVLRVSAAKFALISESEEIPDIPSNPSAPGVGVTCYSGTSIPTLPYIIAHYGTHTIREVIPTYGNADTYEYNGISEVDVELYQDILQSEFGFSLDQTIGENQHLYKAPNGDIVICTYLSVVKRLFVIVDSHAG